MSSQVIHKLLFNLVKSERLIYDSVHWRLSDIERPELIELPTQLIPDRKRPNSGGFSNPDRNAVLLTIRLLVALDVDSLCNKLEQFNKDPGFIYGFKPSYLSVENQNLWAKNTLWKRYEAALLSLGFFIDDSCQRLFEKTLFKEPMRGYDDITSDYFPLFKAFRKQDKLLVNSGLFKNTADYYYSDKASALEIVHWFERMEIALPDRFAERVKKYQVNERSEPITHSSDMEKIGKKERSSMLALIHGMGSKKPYSYDPNDSQNGAINRIESALIDADVSLSDKTIRKYLREANSEAEKLKDKNQ